MNIVTRFSLRKLTEDEIQTLMKNHDEDKRTLKEFLENIDKFHSDWDAKMQVKVIRDGRAEYKWKSKSCAIANKAIKWATTESRIRS